MATAGSGQDDRLKPVAADACRRRQTGRMPELVAGVDGTKRGWVAVVLIDGRFREARLIEGVDSGFSEVADVKRIAVDIPIGFGPRESDGLARALVGGSSVFSIPEREQF